MANQLRMAMVETIVALQRRGWSQRRIARELGIDRETVARHLGRAAAGSKPAIAPIGSEEVPTDPKPAIAPIGSEELPTAAKPAIAPIGSEGSAEGPKPAKAAVESHDGDVLARPATVGLGVVGAKSDEFADMPRQVVQAAAGLGAVGAEAADLVGQPKDAAVPGAAIERTIAAPATDEAAPKVAGAPEVGRGSLCAPWRTVIEGKLELGLSAQRIFQDLVSDCGFTGSYYSVRRFINRLEQKVPLPFRRLECGPGEEVQVDFGTGAPIVGPDGKRRRTHVFRIVLCHSRKACSQAVYRQTTEEFIRCLEDAFWQFGGVPQRLVLDNLRAAVTKADWFEPELNPKVRSFAAHYGVALLPTRPYTPRHKGKIERGVGYVKGNALKGRVFASLQAQNQFLADWEANVADTRLHGTTRRQVGKMYLEVERSALQPLPAERFPFFHEGRRIVHRDGHIEVAKAYYSAPPEYLTREIWVRWDGRLVRLFNHKMEQIAVHVQQELGRFSTDRKHIVSAKISGSERGAAWLLTQVGRIGQPAVRWAEGVLQTRGIEGIRVVQGLLSLAKRHSIDTINQACGTAASYAAYRLRTVRALMARQAPPQEPLPFLDEHPVIRSLADYQQLVHDSFQKERS